LLIKGIHDLVFADTQPIEELWQKWEQPEIWRLPHGHASGQLRLGLMGRVLRWLAPRLDKPFSPDRRTPPNHAPAPNRRPRFPLGSPGQFEYHFCAPPASRAAVGEAQRWAA